MRSSGPRLLRGLVLCGITMAGIPLPAQDTDDYAMKAAFLYNFVRYTDWPEMPARYRFCVIGQDPFGEALQALARKEISGRPIVIQTIQIKGDALDEADLPCDLVFITASEHHRLARIVTAFADRAVVTVAEEGNYDPRLVMLRLGYEQGRLVFDANQTAARAAHLSFGARLLRLARKVF